MNTLEEIEACEKNILDAADIAPYLETDPNMIRWQAHNEPEKLGFPVIVLKKRVKIPKAGFVSFCKYGKYYGEQEGA